MVVLGGHEGGGSGVKPGWGGVRPSLVAGSGGRWGGGEHISGFTGLEKHWSAETKG